MPPSLRSIITTVVAVALLSPAAALAHHSFAMFDRDKTVTIVGMVRQFEWTNPHAWIELDVPNAKGGSDKWNVELNSPNNLARQGWRRTVIKPGDKVSITLSPLHNGEPGGLFVAMKLADGTVFGDLTRAQPPN